MASTSTLSKQAFAPAGTPALPVNRSYPPSLPEDKAASPTRSAQQQRRKRRNVILLALVAIVVVLAVAVCAPVHACLAGRYLASVYVLTQLVRSLAQVLEPG